MEDANVEDDFQKLVNHLIESRLEHIINNEEFAIIMEELYQELESHLSTIYKNYNNYDKNVVIENIKSNIFEQVFNQGKIIYRVAFKDALSFYVDTLYIQNSNELTGGYYDESL